MGSLEGDRPGGRLGDRVAPGEIVYESATTRVVRVRADGSISKEALGADGHRRIRHEQGILRHLSGVAGVVRIRATSPSRALLQLDDGGVALAEVLQQRRLALPEVLLLVEQLARVLAAVHKAGVFHRDVCPANIVVPSAQVLAPPLLIDFDRAATAVGAPSDSFTGTLRYAAPEQSGRTARAADHRSDVYSLGVVLYELVTGRLPFDSADPLELMRDHMVREPVPPIQLDPAVPRALSDVILRALAKDPDARYQSCDGLAHDLQQIREGGEPSTPGEGDFPIRFVPPALLVGREREIADVCNAFDAAIQSAHPPLLISGPAGVGKSALMERLRAQVHAAGGLFLYGKFDQFQRESAVVGGIAQALGSLARQLLASAPGEREQWRAAISNQLGARAASLAFVPEFHVLLGDMGAATVDAERAEQQLMRATMDVLRSAVLKGRAVVLALDDLQWAGAVSLRLFDAVASEPGLQGVLLVGTHRLAQPQDLALTDALARWASSDKPAQHVQVENLQTPAVAELLRHILRVPHERAAQLAPAIHELTLGNPFEVVELLNELRSDGLLSLSRGEWQWDLAAIARFVWSGSGAVRLQSRIARLPSASRDVLLAMGCLGGATEIALLEKATGTSRDDLIAHLQTPVEDQLVILQEDGQLARFRHDLVQQAVLTLVGEEGAALAQLQMARRLAAAGSKEDAARQYLGCVERISGRDEQRAVAELFADVAASSASQAMNEVAERYLAAAAAMLTKDFDALRERVVVARHVLLVWLGRSAEADSLFEELRTHVADPVRLARSVHTQYLSLANRGLRDAALAVCLESLRSLGVPVPEDFEALPLRSALDQAAETIMRHARSDASSFSAATEPRDIVISNLIACLASALGGGRNPPGRLWALLECHRLMRSGRLTPNVAFELTMLVEPLMNVRIDYRAAFELSGQIVEAVRACNFEQRSIVRARSDWLSFTGAWFMPMEDCLDELLQLSDLLRSLSDLPGATLRARRAAMLLFDCESLAACEAQLDVAIDLGSRGVTPRINYHTVIRRDMVRTLRGRTPEPRGPEHGDTTDAASRSWLTALSLKANGYLRRSFAMILGDSDELLACDAGTVPLRPWENGKPLPDGMELTYQAEDFLAYAIQCAERVRAAPQADRAHALAELDRCREFFFARAADQRTNFLHLAYLVEAEHARASGDNWTTALAFDKALQEVRHRRRPWQHALIAERAALFHLANGTEEIGADLMVRSREQYAAWGAVAKVKLLEAAYPWLRSDRASIDQANGFARSSGTPASDTLDMLGILRATRALSSQRSMRDLTAQLVSVLGTLTGATRVSFVARADGEWQLLDTSDEQAGLTTISLPAAGEAGLLPVSVLRYAESTGEALQVDDVERDERFTRDKYFEGRSKGSLLVVPVKSQGQVAAMVLLENDLARSAFGAQRLDAVTLIAGQLAVSLSNAQLYEELEARVRARTEELEKVQGQLVATARRAGMAQVASNVLHNVGNILTSVTVAAAMLQKRLRGSHSLRLSRAVALVREHENDFADFVGRDERGKLLPGYLQKLDEAIEEERQTALGDVDTLMRSIDHINAVVSSQQIYAGTSSVAVEPVAVGELIDDALRMNFPDASLAGTQVDCDCAGIPTLQVDKLRLMQILVNLIANSVEAMDDVDPDRPRLLSIRATLAGAPGAERLRIAVQDSGHGIDPEHVPRLFTHGFTTKRKGHGFGLHGAAIAAMEMGGELTPHSEGPGRGATFTLDVPVRR